MLDPHWHAAAQGFAVNITLIMMIGPQNLLVVRQALLGRPLLTTVLVCLVVDAALIMLGVTGLGAVVTATPWVASMIPWAAVVFLATYAAKAWWSVATPSTRGFDDAPAQSAGRASAAGAAFAVSALNPQAYLDSAVIMGAWPRHGRSKLVSSSARARSWPRPSGSLASATVPAACRPGCADPARREPSTVQGPYPCSPSRPP